VPSNTTASKQLPEHNDNYYNNQIEHANLAILFQGSYCHHLMN
jgi:hypothetical protein